MNKIPDKVLFIPPLLSAGVFSLVAVLVAIGFLLFNDSENPVAVVFIASGIGGFVGFVWGTFVWSDRLARMYEPRIFPQEAEIPTEMKHTVRIELADLTTDGMGEVKWIDLPEGITIKSLAITADILRTNGWNFSHSICGGSKPLTRKQFETLRDLMIANGLAEWKSPHSHNLGVNLTPPGKSMFSKISLPHEKGRGLKLVQMLSNRQAHTYTHGGEL